MISGLSVKITIPIVLISSLALGLTAFLNLGKFDRTLTELESSRTRFVVSDIHANLETGLGLGLPLKGLANAQEVIDFEARKDPSILSISIYDETGTVVFHTGQALGSATVPKSWNSPMHGKGTKHWQVSEGDEHVIGASLTSVIGAPVGGLALRYSQRAHNTIVGSVASALMQSSIIGIVATALIAVFGINFLVARTGKKLQRFEKMLESAAPETAVPTADADAMVLVSGVVNSSRAAMQELSAAQQSLNNALDGGPRREGL